MRLALVGLLAAGGLGLSLILGWSWSASVPATAAEGQHWQRRELTFLKAAYDRIQEDLAQQPRASASLQAEQDRIVRQMTETAKRMPADTVPAEIGALLATVGPPGAGPLGVGPPVGEPVAPAPDTSLSQLIEAVAGETQEVPDLRIGLGGRPQPVVDVTEIVIDPELRQPISRPAIGPRAVPRKAPPDTAARSR